MRIALPNADEVNEKNVVQTVQQVIRALERTADLGGFHDSEAKEEIRLMRQEMRAGFERLGEETNELRQEVREGFTELNNKYDESIDLLKIIAENTRPR